MKKSHLLKKFNYELERKIEPIIDELMKSKNFHEPIHSPYLETELKFTKRYNFKFNDHNHSYWKFLKHCITSVEVDGLWCEFGVYVGSSTKFIANLIDNDIYGFDSFEGLPENWIRFDGDNEAAAGSFKLITPAEKDSVANMLTIKNINLVKGWYDESLPKFLLDNKEKCAFIHIDCDLYSSTKTVLDLLSQDKRIIPGTIIVFDEFYGYDTYKEHEVKAFKEFIDLYDVKYEFIAHTTGEQPWNGMQAALKIKEITYHD